MVFSGTWGIWCGSIYPWFKFNFLLFCIMAMYETAGNLFSSTCWSVLTSCNVKVCRYNKTDECKWDYGFVIFTNLNRASDRSRKKKSNLAGFLGTNSRKNQPISREVCGSFRGKLHQKAIGIKRLILWLFSRQISLEIYPFALIRPAFLTFF